MKVTIYGLTNGAFKRVVGDLGVDWFRHCVYNREMDEGFDITLSDSVTVKSFCGEGFNKIWLDKAGAKSSIEANEFYEVKIL